MSETLEWYAKRGLLSSSDEESNVNAARLAAGRAIAMAFLNSQKQRGLTSNYTPVIHGRGTNVATLNQSERLFQASADVEALLSLVPPRTRVPVERVCLMDQRVGKSMMERLRCGLDAVSQKISKSKKMY